MSIQNLADHDLRSLVKFGSPKFMAQAEAELARRAGQVEGPAEQIKAAARAGGTEAALAGPAFPKGRWS